MSKFVISAEQPLSRFVTVELVLIKSCPFLEFPKVSMHCGPVIWHAWP